MKEMILLILGFALVDLYAAATLLGATPILGQEKAERKLLALGLSVAVLTVIAALLLTLLRDLVPSYLLVLAGAVLALVLACVVRLVTRKPMGLWLGLIALNTAGLSLGLLRVETESTLSLILTALGVGLGFAAALFLLDGVQNRLEPEHMPKAFRGLPIQLLVAGILALALTAFPIG
jgi:electron transport complex protein RnfA